MSVFTESYFNNLTLDQLCDQVDKSWPDIKALCEHVKRQDQNIRTLVRLNDLLLNNRDTVQWHVFEVTADDDGGKRLSFYCACDTEDNAEQISVNTPFPTCVYRSDDSAILTFGGEQ